jgi:hypothetical protein
MPVKNFHYLGELFPRKEAGVTTLLAAEKSLIVTSKGSSPLGGDNSS